MESSIPMTTDPSSVVGGDGSNNQCSPQLQIQVSNVNADASESMDSSALVSSGVLMHPMGADAEATGTDAPAERSYVSSSISVNDGRCRLQLLVQDFDSVMSASTAAAGSTTSVSPTTYSSPGGTDVGVTTATPAPAWEPPSQTQ